MSTTAVADLDVSIPDEIQSAQAKLVYLYVDLHREATLEQVRMDLELTTGTVLSVTNALRERGLLEREDGRFVVR